mgnify:CR=1 FL=1
MTRRLFIPVTLMAAQKKPKARDLFYEAAEKPALGVRYTLFREVNGKWQEVPRGMTLDSGARVRMLFESNTEGELFLLARTAEGKWGPAAPQLPVTIAPDHPYTLPTGGEWILDPPAGEEVLYLIFGRKGEESLKELMQQAGEPLIAAAKVKSRDLVLEVAPSGKAEAAAYAVNPSTERDAKVALEIRIRHRAPRRTL